MARDRRRRLKPAPLSSRFRVAADGASGALAPQHRTRIAVLFGVVCLGFCVVGYRLVCLQVWWAPTYREIALEQHNTKQRIPAARGIISDRAGRLLATTERARSVFANPPAIEDPAVAAVALAPILQRSPRKLFRMLTAEANFVYLQRQVPEPVATAVEQLQLRGIGLEHEDRRYYPNAKLASTLVGFAGVDNQGLAGVEFAYNELLQGNPGWRYMTRDVYGRSLPALTHVHTAPKPGADITLTIDQVVQYHAEEIMRRVMRRQRAKSVTAVVMDPRTGAVLALVSLPDFDPNKYSGTKPSHQRNRTVTDMFEPGSVFKVIPAVAALERGLVQPSTRVYCEEGWYRYYGHVIHDSHPLGVVTFAEVLAESSNIGMVKVANQLAPEELYAYIRAFGFGQRTGIGLAGESPGLLRPPERWSALSMGALPIGQEIGVTALQLAVAYGVIANDGIRMRPYVVQEIRGADGRVLHRSEPEVVQRVCSTDTARAMRHLLAGAVEHGTGEQAAVRGYHVAGKTGTAQKVDPRTGRYSRDDVVAVFAGMVPVERPRFVAVIAVDSPKADDWGGTVAAPAFAELAAEVLQILEVPPTAPVEPEADSAVILAAHPAESTALPPEAYLAAGLMPDLTGRTMREVLTLLEPYPVTVRLKGSGLVYRQTPSPGEPLRANMTCTVRCSPTST